jgi:hypothetical protein
VLLFAASVVAGCGGDDDEPDPEAGRAAAVEACRVIAAPIPGGPAGAVEEQVIVKAMDVVAAAERAADADDRWEPLLELAEAFSDQVDASIETGDPAATLEAADALETHCAEEGIASEV